MMNDHDAQLKELLQFMTQYHETTQRSRTDAMSNLTKAAVNVPSTMAEIICNYSVTIINLFGSIERYAWSVVQEIGRKNDHHMRNFLYRNCDYIKNLADRVDETAKNMGMEPFDVKCQGGDGIQNLNITVGGWHGNTVEEKLQDFLYTLYLDPLDNVYLEFMHGECIRIDTLQ